jgi:hypothetical protein
MLRDGPLNVDDDFFMEELMNNVRNHVISHQSFMLKTAKKTENTCLNESKFCKMTHCEILMKLTSSILF